MTNCQTCGGRAHNAYLCPSCIGELKEMLTALARGGSYTHVSQAGHTASGGGWRIEHTRYHAGLLEHLADAAIGQVKLGSHGRHTEYRSAVELDGESEALPACQCGHPEHELRAECGDLILGETVTVPLDEPDADGNTTAEFRLPDEICQCTEYTPARDQQQIRNAFLTAGKVNPRASELLVDTRARLDGWVSKLPTAFRSLDIADPAVTALWLADNVSAIAKHEDAGLIHYSVRRVVERIERCINRPPTPRFCGRCTSMVTDESGRRTQCPQALYARRDAIEVTCPKCRTTHNIEKLFEQTINAAEHMNWTREQLIGNQRTDSPERYSTGIMGRLPGEFVHYRMFYRWVKDRLLVPRGYQRPPTPDGRVRTGINRHSAADEPLYRLADVRRLRAESTRKANA